MANHQNEHVTVSNLSQPKLDYLAKFKERNKHLTIPPERLYKVVEKNMLEFIEPISLQDLLSFYNGSHEQIVTIPPQIVKIEQPKTEVHSAVENALNQRNTAGITQVKEQASGSTQAIILQENSEVLDFPLINVKLENKLDFNDKYPFLIFSFITAFILSVSHLASYSSNTPTKYLQAFAINTFIISLCYIFSALCCILVKSISKHWPLKLYKGLIISGLILVYIGIFGNTFLR